jgi:hypothetical protein
VHGGSVIRAAPRRQPLDVIRQREEACVAVESGFGAVRAALTRCH